MVVGSGSSEEGSSEVARVYYVMALQDLLPLALGCHYLRPPSEVVGGEDCAVANATSGLFGLECWLVQERHKGIGQAGALAAMSEVASLFVERGGVFGRLQSLIESAPPGITVFLDHRVFEEESDEMEALGGSALDGTGLATVAVVGGAYSPGPEADTHWRSSFRLVSEWVDSLRAAKAGPLPAITDVESIHPVYLMVSESSSSEREVTQGVIDTANFSRGHRRINRATTDDAGWHFMQRRLGNPTTLILDWTTKAFTARAFGDHGQAVTYSAIAAEQAVRHTACFLQWEEQQHGGSNDSLSLGLLFDKHPMDLLKRIGHRLGFDPDPDGCSSEIRAWRNQIAKVRNRVMHSGYYPTGSESDDATGALGDFTHFLVSQIIESAHQYPISTLVLCDPKEITDLDTRGLVLDLSESLDDFVREYNSALTG